MIFFEKDKMATSQTLLTLQRSGQTVQHKDAIGEYSILRIQQTQSQYWVIERRGGYVTLPPGTYSLKMEVSSAKNHSEGHHGHEGRKQFRVMNHHVVSSRKGHPLAAILMHAGSYPKDVVGCMAPGKTKIEGGVGYSRDAMSEIFSILGGFQAGAEFQFAVIGNPTR